VNPSVFLPPNPFSRVIDFPCNSRFSSFFRIDLPCSYPPDGFDIYASRTGWAMSPGFPYMTEKPPQPNPWPNPPWAVLGPISHCGLFPFPPPHVTPNDAFPSPPSGLLLARPCRASVPVKSFKLSSDKHPPPPPPPHHRVPQPPLGSGCFVRGFMSYAFYSIIRICPWF